MAWFIRNEELQSLMEIERERTALELARKEELEKRWQVVYDNCHKLHRVVEQIETKGS